MYSLDISLARARVGSRLTVEIQNQFPGLAISNPMCSCPIFQHLTIGLETPLLAGHLIRIIGASCQITVSLCQPVLFENAKSQLTTYCCCLTLVLLVIVLKAVSATYL